MEREEKGTAKKKSNAFAVRIVRLYRYLCDEKKEYVLSKQLLRSGTSIGANLAEAECAISRKDFLSKVYIALKECMETKYWLELLRETDYLTEQEYQSVNSDCEGVEKNAVFYNEDTKLHSQLSTLHTIKTGGLLTWTKCVWHPLI